ncbi:MAG: hypothetical protein U0L65_01395 [Bacteroidales bacterium]|nr:hypothetical protein [Bacteroidales bacterium]
MKEKIRKFFKSEWLDYYVVGFGILSIILLLAFDCCWLNWALIGLNALMGIGYYLYALYLWLCNKPKFDWHLINGAFMRKVLVLVLLTPFIFAFISLCCGQIGKGLVTGETAELTNPLWGAYYHFIDPGNQHIAEGNTTWLATIIAICGVFLLNGVLISSIVGWIDKRKERYIQGLEPYQRFLKRKEHYVIIGGSDIVEGIVEQIFETPQKNGEMPYILIQTSNNVEDFRHKLFSGLDVEQQKHIIIRYGNRNVKEDIEKLYLDKALEVYVIGEETRTDDMESYHDTMNMKCLNLIYEKVEGNTSFAKNDKDNRLVCYFMFEYQTTFNVFQYSEISGRIIERINFKPFYYYEMWAQRVLVCKELENEANCEYLPLEGIEGIKKSEDDYVHLVIVGMTRMGTALATQAALMAHYPNFVENNIRTKITLIDENADKEKNFYIDRYDRLFALSNWSYKEMVRSESGKDELKTVFTHTPVEFEHLGGDFLDVEWEFIQGSVAQLELQDYIEKSITEKTKMTIAICKDEPSRCLAAALNLEWRIYEKAMQVLVYNRYDDALIEKLKNKKESEVYSPFKNKLKAFGMASKCFKKDILEDSDKLAKEFHKVYCTNKNGKIREEDVEIKKLTDYWSNVYVSNTLWSKLRCVEIEKEEIKAEDKEILVKVEHNRWNIEKLIMSYRHLAKEEQDSAKEDEEVKNQLKREMAHLYICSNKRLREIDEGAIFYDERIVENLIRIKKDFEAKKK